MHSDADADIEAFQLAIIQGDIATAQSYLDRGVGVDDVTAGGFPCTALYRTTHRRHESGYLGWLLFLLEAGADPNHWQGDRSYALTPLFLSVGHNIFGATKLLLEYGANPNLFRGACLHISAINPRVEMLQLLLDYGADYSIKDEDGKLPIDTFEEVLSWKISQDGKNPYENEAILRQMLSPIPTN